METKTSFGAGAFAPGWFFCQRDNICQIKIAIGKGLRYNQGRWQYLGLIAHQALKLGSKNKKAKKKEMENGYGKTIV